MKILDKYLIRNYIKPFGVCVAIFCILVALGRFFDRMGIFNNYHAHLRDITTFILFSIPIWLNLVLPIATMLALLYSLGQHQQLGELTAFRGAGVPFGRLFAPYFGIGLVLSIFSLIGSLSFLPKINFHARTIYRVRIKQEQALQYRHDHVVATGRNRRRFTIGWLDADKNEMDDVIVDRLDADSNLLETMSARRASYQNGQWVLYDGKLIRYDIASGTFKEEPFAQRITDIAERPSDFVMQDKNPEDMTGGELVRQIHRLAGLGIPTYKEQVALHLKIALPFANIVVMALGIPFALRSGRNGRLQTFGYALMVAFLYWGTVSVCQSFGEQGHMPAWLAAWTANVLFSCLAVWMLQQSKFTG